MTVLGRDTTERLRDCADVRGYIEKVCFKTGPPGLVGTELEWLVGFAAEPHRPVPIPLLQDLVAAAGPLPHDSRLTYEPGGQLELSSQAYRGPTACWLALAQDAEHLRTALTPAGVVLLDTAIEPHRPPRRQLSHPRYDAMEAYFHAVADEQGPVMMTSTASVQVNLDIGSDQRDARRRWSLLHAVGPTLVAAFANSPVHAGADTGWKSARQRVWQRLDRSRTAMPAGPDPAAAWADYSLDATVMLHQRDGRDWSVRPGPTFRDWLQEPVPPTAEDLAVHLSTLFPPVRPRGWFEVRYLDEQPWRWWPVPMAVLAALVEDAEAAAVAAAAC
ncbi:MAG: glutamate-cysteine ligase family protein, partial [Nocardioidaceae bacterium]